MLLACGDALTSDEPTWLHVMQVYCLPLHFVAWKSNSSERKFNKVNLINVDNIASSLSWLLRHWWLNGLDNAACSSIGWLNNPCEHLFSFLGNTLSCEKLLVCEHLEFPIWYPDCQRTIWIFHANITFLHLGLTYRILHQPSFTNSKYLIIGLRYKELYQICILNKTRQWLKEH